MMERIMETDQEIAETLKEKEHLWIEEKEDTL